MSRAVNRKCQSCAANKSHEEASVRPCWAGQPCVSKRSHYRNRSQRLAKKQAGYVRERVREITRLDLPLLGYEQPCIAHLVFYRDAADGPIHAVGVEVYDDGELVTQIEAKHCKGMHQDKLRGVLQQWVGVVKVHHGADTVLREVRAPVALCPLCKEGKTNG
ncbi:MAG: hypothetical protein ACR2FS_04665 [Phormidesmis sp.]